MLALGYKQLGALSLREVRTAALSLSRNNPGCVMTAVVTLVVHLDFMYVYATCVPSQIACEVCARSKIQFCRVRFSYFMAGYKATKIHILHSCPT